MNDPYPWVAADRCGGFDRLFWRARRAPGRTTVPRSAFAAEHGRPGNDAVVDAEPHAPFGPQHLGVAGRGVGAAGSCRLSASGVSFVIGVVFALRGTCRPATTDDRHRAAATDRLVEVRLGTIEHLLEVS